MDVRIPNELIISAIKQQLESMVPRMLDQRLKQELHTKKVYNIRESCILLNMSFNTLKRFLTEGQIKHTMIGNRPGFTESNLVEFIRSGRWSRITIPDFNRNKISL